MQWVGPKWILNRFSKQKRLYNGHHWYKWVKLYGSMLHFWQVPSLLVLCRITLFLGGTCEEFRDDVYDTVCVCVYVRVD